MLNPTTAFSTLVFATLAFAAYVPSSTEVYLNVRKPTPCDVGICGPNFITNEIVPVMRCTCQALFKGLITVNVQNLAQRNCRTFFGSVDVILGIDNPCAAYTNHDGSLKKKNIQKKVQEVRDTCFPKASGNVS